MPDRITNMHKSKLTPRIITKFGIEAKHPNWPQYITAESVNLSENGLCVRLKRQLKKGDQLELKITIACDEPAIETVGTVAWAHEKLPGTFYCGIGLKNLELSQKNILRQYVEEGGRSLLNFFSEFPLFSELSEEDCKELLQVVTRHELQKKETLYHQGQMSEYLQGLFIVESGLLGIYNGREISPERKIAVVSAGQIFGETTLISNQPHSATIIAVNPSRLIQISKLGFLVLRKDSPQLGLKLMDIVVKTLSSRLGRTTKLLFSPVHFTKNR